jgi:hypothetical protein
MVGHCAWEKKMGCLLVAFKVFHYKFGQYIWDKTMVLFAIRPKVMIVKFMALDLWGVGACFPHFLTFLNNLNSSKCTCSTLGL